MNDPLVHTILPDNWIVLSEDFIEKGNFLIFCNGLIKKIHIPKQNSTPWHNGYAYQYYEIKPSFSGSILKRLENEI